MGRYRKVDTRIWNDARIICLDDDSKLVFLFVLTHPHLTSLGAMRATVPGLAAELGWTTERFQKAFDELTDTVRNGESGTVGHALIDYNQDASFIGLPNFLKYNQPENPNVVTSWGSLVDLLPECEAKTRLLERVQRCVTERGEGFASAWENVSGTVCRTVPEGLPQPSGKPFRKGSEDSGAVSGNGMPNPEPEPKPEQEPKPSKKNAATVQEPIQIPDELDTPAGRTALDEFREHRRQLKKPLTALAESKLLTEWSQHGVARFVAAVDHSISNGWQGLFEPDGGGNAARTGTTRGGGQRPGRVAAPVGKYDDDSDVIDLTDGGAA